MTLNQSHVKTIFLQLIAQKQQQIQSLVRQEHRELSCRQNLWSELKQGLHCYFSCWRCGKKLASSLHRRTVPSRERKPMTHPRKPIAATVKLSRAELCCTHKLHVPSLCFGQRGLCICRGTYVTLTPLDAAPGCLCPQAVAKPPNWSVSSCWSLVPGEAFRPKGTLKGIHRKKSIFDARCLNANIHQLQILS